MCDSIVIVTFKALRYCHSLSVVHKDVNPSNVLCTGEGHTLHVILADFGISEVLNEPGVACRGGTLPYMSPELLTGCGDAYDEKTDIWSAAITCLELVYISHL
jgi:calcium/calmodulin-dependent protein kinase I